MVDDPELIELVELELRELISKYGFRVMTFPSFAVGAEGSGDRHVDSARRRAFLS